MSDTKSYITGFTSKTKTGAFHKHCMLGKCDGKRISGAHWARHVEDIHKGPLGSEEGRNYIKCAEAGCNACSQGKYTPFWTSPFGPHLFGLHLLDLTFLDLTFLDLTFLDLTFLDLTFLDLTFLDIFLLFL
jgi:hypothetical protein